MSKHDELKRLAEAECISSELGSFENPQLCAAILELIAENERNERMLLAACMDMGAIGEALGADMNSDGEELLSMVVDMKAENEQLSAQIADPEFPPKYSRRLIAQLRAEIESLKEVSHV